MQENQQHWSNFITMNEEVFTLVFAIKLTQSSGSHFGSNFPLPLYETERLSPQQFLVDVDVIVNWSSSFRVIFLCGSRTNAHVHVFYMNNKIVC